ncbi:solute carrier family 41 member 2 [Salvelinus sp. IW2-2015]|uniref:solute carrier family 41 member 2 n=1 Tax=Salvelinus sp. IW2-2015 TaxID=2691554 RepID=UPI000CEB0304|nr:solute carrier family 41 member 2-like [Salvelinus alpinus]
MNIHTLGDSLGPSLAVRMSGAAGGWSSLSLKPVPTGWIPSLFQTMVPTGYTKLQEERGLAMADLGPKPDGNGYRPDPPHLEVRRHSDRVARTSVSLSDGGDVRYSETEPMLPEGTLSGEEGDDEEKEEEESQRPPTRNMPKESPLAMALQIVVPFLLAGFGTVSAGMVLDIVQHWDAFKYITEIFILVPALLGLKGNLEMTLASRLSTAVNVGKMDSPIEKWNLIIGNLALKQVQATVVGFLAAVAAVVLGWIPEGKFQMSHAVLLCSASVATAFIASMLQGFIMVGVIVGSKKTGINPDNVATPIAASFGDLITLAILAWISQGLYNCLGKDLDWIFPSGNKTQNQTLTLRVVSPGVAFLPVVCTPKGGCIGGLILDKTVSDPTCGIGVGRIQIWVLAFLSNPHFRSILSCLQSAPALSLPVLSSPGIGGNLVAIQSSRISTHLHFHSAPGEVPEEAKGCYYPCRTFCGTGANHRSAQVLLLLVLPGHLIFLYTIHLMKSGHTTLTPIFMTVYLAAALLQVFLLLCIADWMVYSMWRSGKDPDSFSIPYLTALGDLLGTALLALSFQFLWYIGDQDSDVGD